MQTSPQRFGTGAIFLHWAVAVVLLICVVIAWAMDAIDDGDPKGAALALHKSVGIVVFILACVRAGWRATHRAPAFPPEMSRFQRWSASAVHWLLYAAILTMPISGYVAAAARGRETPFFGLFAMPQWVPLDRSLSHLAETAHDYSQYALYALVVVHVGAALYHHVILRDQIMLRMMPQRWVKLLDRTPRQMPSPQ